MTTSSDNRFHDHLDVCEQCREHPFDLCSVGLPLLVAGATEAGVGLKPPGGQHFADVVKALVVMRDKAILSLGFFASLRRAEVVALKVTDLEFTPEGLILHIRRSKTDQLAVGDTVGLVAQRDPEVCPIALTERYLDVSGLKDGPLFRRIDPRSDAIGAKHMIPQSIAIIVQRTAELAGLDPDKVFSGHSLRAGFATTSAVKGRTLPQIMRQGRWKDQRTAMMYIRPATVWQDNPTAGLGDDEPEKKR